jgi:hypothetical protein
MAGPGPRPGPLCPPAGDGPHNSVDTANARRRTPGAHVSRTDQDPAQKPQAMVLPVATRCSRVSLVHAAKTILRYAFGKMAGILSSRLRWESRTAPVNAWPATPLPRHVTSRATASHVVHFSGYAQVSITVSQATGRNSRVRSATAVAAVISRVHPPAQVPLPRPRLTRPGDLVEWVKMPAPSQVALGC